MNDEKKIGKVIEALPNLNFKIESDGKIYQCYTSGKMRMNKIRILIGDTVEFVLDKYGHIGRITRRK